MNNFCQIHDNSECACVWNKNVLLNEVGRVVTFAYEQGVTLEEVKAICGAAYGDWQEARDLNE